MPNTESAGRDGILAGLSVLILEDEPLVAMDLQAAVESEGGEVLGPATTVAHAKRILAGTDVDAAILDINLPDGDAGAVMDLLAPKGAVMLAYTGQGMPPELRTRHPLVDVCTKPERPETLIGILAERLQMEGS